MPDATGTPAAPDATPADDLAAFLAARYDEAQALAEAATPGPWTAIVHTTDDQGIIIDSHYPPGNGHILGSAIMSDDETRNRENAAHIAATDPAHRLRDIALKRAILAEHKHYPAFTPDEYDFGCGVCHDNGDYGVCGYGWCATVRHLGTEFSDHPDYRPEWKPDGT